LLKSDAKPEKMIDLHIKLGKATMDKVITLAGIRRETASSVIRQILAAGLDNEIAEQSSETLVSVVRKTIRAELKSTENRLADLGAKAGIAAGTAEQMVADMVKRAVSTPGMTPEEKKRQARFLHEEARKKAVAQFKKSIDEWMVEGGDESA
jgi:hypothetical protein